MDQSTAPQPFTPEPGVHVGTSLNMYHNVWSAASNSRLSILRRSPAHLLAAMHEPPKSSAALLTGHAIHTAILEPDLFASEFTTAGQCQAIKKTDKLRCNNAGVVYSTAQGWLCGVHKGADSGSDDSRTVLSQADYVVALAVRDAVHRHPAAKHLLSTAIHREASIAWDDARSGVRCKARLDSYAEFEGGTIIDVKSTIDARRDEFERSIFKYGYHRQGGFYMPGAEAVGLPARHFVIIACEKEPPYAVAVYRLTEGALDAGAEQIAPLLDLYAKCMASGEWPAYSDEIADIALPSWSWDKIDQELTERSRETANAL